MLMEPKKLVEVESEGLVSLIGKNVTFFCANYIYTGKLEGVNEKCVKITSAKIVYETGSFDETDWKDAQSLPNPVYIMIGFVESFTILK
jgi:hypothetical protein